MALRADLAPAGISNTIADVLSRFNNELALQLAPGLQVATFQHHSSSSRTALLTQIKAEHECGSPAAHYRYTRGFSHGYGNLQIRVTCHHRSTRIWVLVLGLRVLAKSTCETRVLFLFYLPILLLLCYIF